MEQSRKCLISRRLLATPHIRGSAVSIWSWSRAGCLPRCRFRRVWARRRACCSRCWRGWPTRSCPGGLSTSLTGARSWTRRRWPSAAGSAGSGRCPSWRVHSTVARPFRVRVRSDSGCCGAVSRTTASGGWTRPGPRWSWGRSTWSARGCCFPATAPGGRAGRWTRGSWDTTPSSCSTRRTSPPRWKSFFARSRGSTRVRSCT